MKARTLILSAILLPIAAAQVSNTDALNDLRKTHPTVKWRSQPLAVADVLCEGKPGTVILGSEKDDVVDFLNQLSTVARRATASGHHLYCWISL